MIAYALDYIRFSRRARIATRFATLSHQASQRWSADPAVGEGYYHVRWIAQPPQGRFAGETWLVGDQPWADAPEFMVWGLDRRKALGDVVRFSWMFQEWPSEWSRSDEA